MKKWFLLFLFLFFLVYPVKALEYPFQVSSKSAILYDLNEDEILYEKNSKEEMAMASLTKIMTAIVAIEHIENLDDSVILKPHIFYGLEEANASVAGFYDGEKVTYRDLLYGAMFPSGADATRALAFSIASSIEDFVTLMNEKAVSLKMEHTHFTNDTGLDENGHYSTAYDMMLLLKYALKNKDFYDIFVSNIYHTSNGKHIFRRTYEVTASRVGIDGIDYIKGAKTGYTDAALRCLASYASYEDRNYILINLGSLDADNRAYHIEDAKIIYDYFFEHYKLTEIVPIGEPLVIIKTPPFVIQKEIIFTNQQPISKYLFQGENISKVLYDYHGIEDISYGMKKGTLLGKVDIYFQNELLATRDIILPLDIDFQFSLWIKEYWYYGVIFVLLIFISFLWFGKRLKKGHK